MTLVRYNPFTSLKSGAFESIFDELSGRTLSDLFTTEFTNSSPSTNIIEKDDSFVLELAAPGLNKDDFSITIEKNHLVVAAKKESSSEGHEKNGYTKREFNYESFKRSFHLSEKISREDISAKYENGILVITLSKTLEEKGTRKTIEIV